MSDPLSEGTAAARVPAPPAADAPRRGVRSVGVALQWSALRVEVEPLTGEVTVDGDLGGGGCSPADEAALECALGLGEAWDVPVIAACVGPPEAEELLRTALAAGAARAVLVEPPVAAREADAVPGALDALPAETVADALAGVLADAAVVCCGDRGLDRGSGAVPAFLAARLGAAQALGCVSVAPTRPGELRAERRLDGGRRELLRVTAPAVVSVETGAARLRRASLPGVLAARTAPVGREAVEPPPASAVRAAWTRQRPYRPRASVLGAPSSGSVRDRILELTGALTPGEPPRRIEAGAEEAAEAILDQLHAWGYR